eukprot:9146320-Pyramimonas_sp.AAC.1
MRHGVRITGCAMGCAICGLRLRLRDPKSAQPRGSPMCCTIIGCDKGLRGNGSATHGRNRLRTPRPRIS